MTFNFQEPYLSASNIRNKVGILLERRPINRKSGVPSKIEAII